MASNTIPPRLQRIITLFAASPGPVKLDALVDYSQRLPAPVETMERSKMERVKECQSTLFVATEVSPDGTVRLYFDAPQEAPTTRGFAAILAAGLDGLQASEVLEVPDDFYNGMGLAEVVSPMRLRGMHSLLRTIKRQITAALDDG